MCTVVRYNSLVTMLDVKGSEIMTETLNVLCWVSLLFFVWIQMWLSVYYRDVEE